jgi:hypothetical protein
VAEVVEAELPDDGFGPEEVVVLWGNGVGPRPGPALSLCLGRKMCQAALNLTEHVLPAVPLRQWLFTLPHTLRARLAYDAPLLGAVTRLFVDSVLGWYQRLAHQHALAQSGAVVAVPRASSDLKLNPHLHAGFLDGV